ncbi:MAG: ribosome biogenesis GTP-binding protein YihA/YsxC [Oscillospiraceae bacterium]|nr:ribosome biogenesis GTP-binding protein YihA/YsxC [Oscillospiraceae bacterium]
MNLHRAEFVKSAASQEQFIRDGLPQFVFAGRSNVGKSSVINSLLGRRNFARVGDTPGKTVHVNYFLIDNKIYFVDLPGYGYARAARSEKRRWAVLMESFFTDFADNARGFLIVDVRHAPTQDDKTMASWFQQTCVPFSVIINKADKLKERELPARVEEIRRELVLDERDKTTLFSAKTGRGKDEVLQMINAPPHAP